MPGLLKFLEKLNFEQLKEKLNAIKETSAVWKNNPEAISWSAMLGTIIVIAVVISTRWRLKGRIKKLLIKQNVPAVERRGRDHRVCLI